MIYICFLTITIMCAYYSKLFKTHFLLCKYFTAFFTLKRQTVRLKDLDDIKQLVIKNTFSRRNH